MKKLTKNKIILALLFGVLFSITIGSCSKDESSGSSTTYYSPDGEKIELYDSYVKVDGEKQYYGEGDLEDYDNKQEYIDYLISEGFTKKKPSSADDDQDDNDLPCYDCVINDCIVTICDGYLTTSSSSSNNEACMDLDIDDMGYQPDLLKKENIEIVVKEFRRAGLTCKKTN